MILITSEKLHNHLTSIRIAVDDEVINGIYPRKSAGCDDIPLFIVKNCVQVLAQTLLPLFNESKRGLPFKISGNYLAFSPFSPLEVK